MFYEVRFETVIRGHHVYNARLTPVKNEKLVGLHEKRAEAKEYDKFEIGIFKFGKENLSLIGRASIKLSSLLFHFFNNDESTWEFPTVNEEQKNSLHLAGAAKKEERDELANTYYR